MRKFIPSNKNNPCPICDDTTGKCRSKEDNGKEFFLCMPLSNAKKGEIINGYKCITECSPTKSYPAATFVLDNSQEWTEEQKDKWEQEKRRRQQEKAREDEARKQNSLSNFERDKWYRKLLSYLTLNEADLADLKQRGFTDEQVQLSGFKSVERYHKLPEKFPSKLPGVSEDGTFLTNKYPGYLCPIRNFEGQILGIQIRARNTEDGNRYQWLSSRQATLHLQNGELPLAVFSPKKPEGIALAEGTGAKPFLTSGYLNLLTIGAAGGQWLSSPQLFKEYLDKASKRVGNKRVKLFPDAGDILNPHTLSRWESVSNNLQQWGWEVFFGWWNQVTKEHSDIDELDDLDSIDYITHDEFFKIAERAKKESEQKARVEAEKARIARDNEIFIELSTIREKPWKTVNQKELDLQSLGLEDGAVYIVDSAKGTGKTKGVKPILADYKAGYAWFSRVALGKEECHKLGIIWKDDMATSNGKRRGFCSDSAHQFDPKLLSENRSFLLIDEADQVFDHNFGDTCNKDGKRPMILATLEAHLESVLYGGGIALFMSADISQKEIDYIREITPVGYPVRLISNEYKPPKCDLYFDESKNPDGMIENLLAKLENDTPCFLIDDIKNGVRGCKSIAEYVRSIHPEWANEIVEINSDTSGDADTSEYLKSINEASLKTRLISCSPSVVSGISIENGRFTDGVFGFFNGILTINNASQALSRVRGANEVNVWAAETGLVYVANRDTDPKEINGYYQRNYEQNSKHLLTFGVDYSPIKSEWSSPHWKLKCKNDAYRNLCMDDLRERLKAKLEDEGYNIILDSSEGSDMVESGLKETWGKIELSEAEAVANANILGDEQLNALQNSSEPLTPQQKLDVEKSMMLKSFGKELIEATTFVHKESGKVLSGYAAMYLKNERGDYLRKLQNFYFFTQEISEAIHADLSREHSQERHGFGRFPGDIRWRTRAAKCREFLGLKQFLNPDLWTQPNDYRELAEKAKRYAPIVKDALGVNVEKMRYQSQVFKALLEQLALGLDAEWVEDKGKDTTSGKRKRWKRRRISEESWEFAQMYVAYRNSLKARAGEDSSFGSTPPLNKPLYINKGGSIQSEIESQRGHLATSAVMDRPPLSIYTELDFRGGSIQGETESQQRKLQWLRDELIAAPTVHTFWHIIGDSELELEALVPIIQSSKVPSIVEWWNEAMLGSNLNHLVVEQVKSEESLKEESPAVEKPLEPEQPPELIYVAANGEKVIILSQFTKPGLNGKQIEMVKIKYLSDGLIGESRIDFLKLAV